MCMLCFWESIGQFNRLPSCMRAINLWSYSISFFSAFSQLLLPHCHKLFIWNAYKHVRIWIWVKLQIFISIDITFAIFKPFSAKLNNIFRLWLDDVVHQTGKHWLYFTFKVYFVAILLCWGKGGRWEWLFHNFEYVWNYIEI